MEKMDRYMTNRGMDAGRDGRRDRKWTDGGGWRDGYVIEGGMKG